jgi:hypothetical protein
VRINFAGELCFGEDIGKLRVAGYPMELMDTVLLTLTDKLEASFDVASLNSFCRRVFDKHTSFLRGV